MNMGAHNAGFITYVAILTMSFLLLLAFMGCVLVKFVKVML